MTWAMHSVGWLEFGEEYFAASQFRRNYDYMLAPFNVSEPEFIFIFVKKHFYFLDLDRNSYRRRDRQLRNRNGWIHAKSHPRLPRFTHL